MKFFSQILLLAPAVVAFTVAPPSPTSRSSVVLLNAESNSRRTLVQNTFVASAAIMGLNLPVSAEEVVDDLAMPTEDEQAKAKAEMEERIRKKMELQKKAAKPATFAESLEKEKEKKAELAKSKEERRNALCEELGRGC